MARDLKEAPEHLFIGLEVVFTEWHDRPHTVTLHYVGPYLTKAAVKGQVKNRAPYKVWADRTGWVYEESIYHRRAQSSSDAEGRRRVDSVVLVCEPTWTIA